MPYEIRVQDGLIRIRFHGVVVDSELADFGDSLLALEAGLPLLPDRIADFTDVTQMRFGFPAMLELAERRKNRTLPNRIRTAIIATDGVRFGYARMFQTLNDHPQVTIAIFRDLETALGWITSPR